MGIPNIDKFDTMMYLNFCRKFQFLSINYTYKIIFPYWYGYLASLLASHLDAFNQSYF